MKSNYEKKSPCKICFEKGYDNRYHPVEVCRNRLKTDLSNYNEEDENITLIFTAVDNPQSNGMNERLNQTLVNRIRCRKNETRSNQRPWSKIREQRVEEYYHTLHGVTKYTPAYLLYGITTDIIHIELKKDNITNF